MIEFSILVPAILNGLTTGAVYALVALGLTLIYGVLHIINFAHGSLLMLALYGVYFLYTLFGIDPYLALPIAMPAMFALGYVLQRYVIGQMKAAKDENILLVTLGLSIIIENLALYAWKSDTRTINTPYGFSTIDFGIAVIAVPKVVAFAGALVVTGLLWLLMRRTDLGRAIRALAKERQGARLVGIHV
jgi:branched-chain amino acid transport system permease protein